MLFIYIVYIGLEEFVQRRDSAEFAAIRTVDRIPSQTIIRAEFANQKASQLVKKAHFYSFLANSWPLAIVETAKLNTEREGN